MCWLLHTYGAYSLRCPKGSWWCKIEAQERGLNIDLRIVQLMGADDIIRQNSIGGVEKKTQDRTERAKETVKEWSVIRTRRELCHLSLDMRKYAEGGWSSVKYGSRRTRIEKGSLYLAIKRSLTTLEKTASIEWWGLKLQCEGFRSK